jgi:hypothetical protein
VWYSASKGALSLSGLIGLRLKRRGGQGRQRRRPLAGRTLADAGESNLDGFGRERHINAVLLLAQMRHGSACKQSICPIHPYNRDQWHRRAARAIRAARTASSMQKLRGAANEEPFPPKV